MTRVLKSCLEYVHHRSWQRTQRWTSMENVRALCLGYVFSSTLSPNLALIQNSDLHFFHLVRPPIFVRKHTHVKCKRIFIYTSIFIHITKYWWNNLQSYQWNKWHLIYQKKKIRLSYKASSKMMEYTRIQEAWLRSKEIRRFL